MPGMITEQNHSIRFRSSAVSVGVRVCVSVCAGDETGIFVGSKPAAQQSWSCGSRRVDDVKSRCFRKSESDTKTRNIFLWLETLDEILALVQVRGFGVRVSRPVDVLFMMQQSLQCRVTKSSKPQTCC